MHQSLDVGNFIVAIKACVHYFYFCHQNKTFNKLAKIIFILSKKLLLSSRFLNFCTSLFLSFFLFWSLLILQKKLIDNKF